MSRWLVPMIEVWPTVKDITLSAYFVSESDWKSSTLCEMVKRALDQVSTSEARAQGREPSSYRSCMTIRDAVSRGYIQPKR